VSPYAARPAKFVASIAAAVATLLLIGGCATRPVNPPLGKFDPSTTYQLQRAGETAADRENFVILAFSGGGTRAASFAFGVLEALRDIEVEGPRGGKGRLLDFVDVITGVSGGSFTALAYGLYGDKMFAEYEQRFLKRNVQGELVSRAFNPGNWGALSSTGWGRSELAADLYDEILFNGATFADLQRPGAPLIAPSATDLSTGARVVFIRQNFDVFCADLSKVRLSRAAAASSSVPVVLSPVTINNYAGTCGYQEPAWTKLFDANNPPRPAARTMKRLSELREFADTKNEPYLHLVDGGISDNLGLRGVIDLLATFEALHEAGQKTPLDNVKRIIVFIVNSLSSPETDWNRKEDSPGTIEILVKAAGVPIDRYSDEAVELLKDTAARWKVLRQVRDSPAVAADKDPRLSFVRNAPNADIYAIDVSFKTLKDAAERNYLNQLPTSFVLPPEAVDRLRAAARTAILESPEFARLLKESGAKIVVRPPPAPATKPLP
jgi:NTE family protein